MPPCSRSRPMSSTTTFRSVRSPGRRLSREALSGAIGRADRVEWIVTHQVVQGDVVMNERLDRFLVDGRWIEIPVAGLFVLREGRIALWRDYFDLETYRRQTRGGQHRLRSPRTPVFVDL